MDEKEIKNNIPMIIDNGILYNPKDIQKVLRDLGLVTYQQIINNETKASGEGYIVSVVVNNTSANIILNKRLYLNVNGFEYMKVNTEGEQTNIDLYDPFGILRLIPLNNPTNEGQNSDLMNSQNIEYLDEDFDDAFVEINVDEDFDDE